MLDRQLPRTRMVVATRRRITTLTLVRTSQYGLRAIAAPGLVAAIPGKHGSYQPSI